MKKAILTFIITVVGLTGWSQFSELTYEEFVQKQKSFTTSDELKMAYIDEGKGDAVLLLHGVPTSSWLYRKLIDSLVSHGKRVIIPDLIGFGQSDKPKKVTDYNYDLQAKRVMELANNLGLSSWTQVCHDMGSLVTWKMLDIDPTEKITKLVILNSILQENGFNPPMKFKKGFLGKTYSKTYCSFLGKSMIKATLNNGLYDSKIDKRSLHGYVKPLKKNGHHALYEFFTSFEEIEDITDGNEQRFNNFNGEVTFIWGIHDKILTLQQADYFLQHLNNDKTNIIHLGKSSHFVQEQELTNYINKI